MTKVLKTKKKNNSTDISLMVESTSQEEIFEYDENRIVESLIKEIGCPINIAKDIANTVTERIKKLDMNTITPALIRSFVNVSLYEKGFDSELKSESEIVIPINDIESIIESKDKSNGNTPHNPESINLEIAETAIKQYVLKKLLTPELRQYHLNGDIHIHDMGMFDRFYCSGHNPEYIKKYGIKNMNNIPTTSKPATKAYVAARHLASSTLFFTSLFAGAIGWDAINIFFSPLLIGFKHKDYIQLAQTLMFDFSQLAGAKGGQVSFVDFNCYSLVPKHYRETYAIGEGGQYMVRDNIGDIHYFKDKLELEEYANKNEYTILKYKDFEYEAQQFLRALIEVSIKGDALEMPFGFPKLHFHIDNNSFKNPQANELLKLACKCLSKMGNPYIDFDRNAMSMSQCCRLVLVFDDEDVKLTKTPEELRFVGGQNVSINLANLPLKVGKNEDDIYKELKHRMDLSAEAHIIRLNYIKRLVDLPDSPLEFYKKGADGKPYVRYDKISWLIGLVGLNEYVYNLTGKELHESKNSFLKGIELITLMSNYCEELSKKYNMNFKLEETPAESTAGRFAKLDRKKYGNNAFCQENEYGIYYSNSIHFAVKSPMDYIDKTLYQSKFHPLVQAGSMIHNWVGDRQPNEKALYDFLKNVWDKTKCSELTITPDKTTCRNCEHTSNGFHDKCPYCGSENVFWTTRITGYQVVVENFGNSKKAELKDRDRQNIIEDTMSFKKILVNDIPKSKDQLEIYSLKNCPNCQQVKEYCDKNNIQYVIHYPEDNFKAKARLIVEGLEYFPVININNNFYECNDIDFIIKKVSEIKND